MEYLTFSQGITIFSTMSKDNPSNIEALEAKVEELLALTRQLSQENTELKAQLNEIRNDRSHLVEQKEQVRSQVEGMIARLKTMETA